MPPTESDPTRVLTATDEAAGRRPAARPTGRLSGVAHDAWALLTERPLSLHAAAVLRIGYGLLYLGFLLREFPHRDDVWGPGSPWTPELARQLFDQTGWTSVLTLSDSRAYFELCYAAALVVCALFALGWRTRAVSVLFAVVVASFHARAIFITDGGDNLVLLMALYLVLTASGRRWSLDARRSRRRSAANAPDRRRPAAASRLRQARTTLVTTVHNCGLFAIAFQICVLYGAAGLYKVQGGTWGAGTALYYALNLELFQPWPAFSHWVAGHAAAVAMAGYVTVLLQVAFPFVLFGRLKYPVLAVLLGMHIGIAVLMGLPLFSGAMIIADAVFLPDRFWIAVADRGRRVLRWPGAMRAASVSGRRAVPGQVGPAVLVKTRP